MTRFSTVVFTALIVFAASASTAPIQHAKRIAQTTIDAPKKWEDACVRKSPLVYIELILIPIMQNAAGGGQKCNPIAVTAASTLLAAADVCAQQNSADQMISLGKQLNNQDMIIAAQIFVQQPRNSVRSCIALTVPIWPLTWPTGAFLAQLRGYAVLPDCAAEQ
jgi:hypothetical protein